MDEIRKLLLFGFDDPAQVMAVRAAAGPFGAEAAAIGPRECGCSLGELAKGGAQVSQTPALPLGMRMIVLCGLDGEMNRLLPALRQAGIGPDCLKAVLTPSNRTWTPAQLYAELSAERAAIERQRGRS
jgi:hypothetical protein